MARNQTLKWQVGDIVKIREDLCSDTPDYTNCGFLSGMQQYVGKTSIVRHVGANGNVQLSDTFEWWWAPNWLIPVVDTTDDINSELPSLDSIL